jgi:PAS domain S-box-containing protein
MTSSNDDLNPITCTPNEENLLLKVLEYISDSVIVHDFKGKIIYINRNTYESRGYSHDEFMSLDLKKIDSPEQQKFINERLDKIKELGDYSFESVHIRKDGSSFPVDIHSSFMEYDGTDIILSIIRDSSERIKQKNEREELIKRIDQQKAELRTVLDSIPAMVFYKDTKNNLIRVNDAFAQSMKTTVSDLEGKSCFELWPDVAQNYYDDDLEVIESGDSKLNIIEPLDTPTGRRWVKTDKILYHDKDGNIVGVIGFAVDITDLKNAEEELKKQNLQLKQFNEIAVERELRMIALKREVNTLLERLDEEPRYNVPKEVDE